MKSRFLSLIVLFFLAVMFFLGQQALATRDGAGHFSNPTPTWPPAQYPQGGTPLHEEETVFSSAQAIRQFAQTEVTTQQVNGVDVSVANFRLENERVRVDACYSLPDDKDWVVNAASLRADEQNFLFAASYLLEVATTGQDGKKQVIAATRQGLERKAIPSDAISDYRCDTLEFFPYPPPTREIDFSRLTLVINSLQARPREGQDCEFYLNVVQEALNRDHTGIKLGCDQGEWGLFDLQVIQKPTDMTQEESRAIISQYAQKVWTIEGPWVFTGSIVLPEANQ